MAYSGAIDGLISGLNTTNIIETIMKFEQQRVGLYTARQTELTNKISSWKSIEALLLGFKMQASILADERFWYARSVAISDDDIVSATASTNASPGVFYLNVNRLATNHQIASQGFNIEEQSIGTGTVTIRLGSGQTTTITIDSSNDTLAGLKNAINNANAGVSAAIVSDGSYSNQYRLVLTSKETGQNSTITFTSNLSGGIAPDFSTPQFDVVEKLIWNGSTTSNPALGASAAYSGTVNKTYTFTVAGSGLQTVGSGDITLDWTDGTNSGSVVINAADTDFALSGTGADGLAVRFSAGVLNGGDKFQIQAFAPVIQGAQNAEVQFGSTSGGGSPITISSSSNTLKNLIQGVTLELHALTSPGKPVEIRIAEDRNLIKEQIREFVNKYNEYQEFVNKQFSYKKETGVGGILLGEGSLLTLHNDVRSLLSHVYEGRTSELRMLSQVGVKFDSYGKLKFDEAVFNKKIDENFLGVVNLFKSTATSDSDLIEYISSTVSTKATVDGYKVDITRAAQRGMFTGLAITNPLQTPLVIDSTNNVLRLKINNNVTGLITLTPKTYTSGAELAQDLENAINGDSAAAAVGVDVEWVDNGGNGNLVLYTRSYGSRSSVTIEDSSDTTAHSVLGLAGGTATAGQDVAGTINGEPATGNGQYLIGNSDNKNTAGLKLKITATADQIVEGVDGTILFNKGIAALLEERLNRYTDSYEGILKGRTDSIQQQVNNIAKQITALEKQLERKRAALYKQFAAMEEALGKLKSQQEYLTAAVSNLSQLRTTKGTTVTYGG